MCNEVQGTDHGDHVTVAIANYPDAVPYERITVKAKGKIKTQIWDATKLLNYGLCIETRTNYLDRKAERDSSAMKHAPKNFPFLIRLVENVYDRAFFKKYDGPIYWNHSEREFLIDWDQPEKNFEPGQRLFYSMLKPIKIREAGGKPLTARSLCEAVSKLDYSPGDFRFLERIGVELRKIDGVHAITIIFHCGS